MPQKWLRPWGQKSGRKGDPGVIQGVTPIQRHGPIAYNECGMSHLMCDITLFFKSLHAMWAHP